MTVRVFNGQTNTSEPLVWRHRLGVSRLEPESGWVNPSTICEYYKSLIPRDRAALIELLRLAEIEKTEQELADDHAYELARLANKPLTE
jgi:hypothetical protein